MDLVANTRRYFIQLAWVISFVGSIVANIQTDFPNYVWWAIAYMFCCIGGVIVVIGSDSSLSYGVAVSVSPMKILVRTF